MNKEELMRTAIRLGNFFPNLINRLEKNAEKERIDVDTYILALYHICYQYKNDFFSFCHGGLMHFCGITPNDNLEISLQDT